MRSLVEHANGGPPSVFLGKNGQDRKDAITKHERPGRLRRALTAFGSVLKRGILGKSTHAYMKQFTADDEYWDRVIAAQVRWHQPQPSKADLDRFRSSA
jgi:hypothetical protein